MEVEGKGMMSRGAVVGAERHGVDLQVTQTRQLPEAPEDSVIDPLEGSVEAETTEGVAPKEGLDHGLGQLQVISNEFLE